MKIFPEEIKLLFSFVFVIIMSNYILMEGMHLSSGKRIYVLVGPSGSGKTTIGNELSKHGIKKLVTTTTRQPRNGELNGVDYYFITKDELSDNAFVERSEYSGNVYGLTKKEIQTALTNHNAMHVALDKNGAQAMVENFPEETYVIFIEASIKILKERMEERGDSEGAIINRINFLKQTNEDTRPHFANLSIENDDLNKSVDIILNSH